MVGADFYEVVFKEILTYGNTLDRWREQARSFQIIMGSNGANMMKSKYLLDACSEYSMVQLNYCKHKFHEVSDFQIFYTISQDPFC